MDQQIVTPQQQLSKVVIRVWIIGEIIANFIGLLVLAALFFWITNFHGRNGLGGSFWLSLFFLSLEQYGLCFSSHL